jgi:O-acetylserine/cysteine efflux transporter
MKPIDVSLAVLVATIWGVAAIVSKVGLVSFTPTQLIVLRFMIAGVAAFWLPRPKISWIALISIGLTVFAGQFLFQFLGIVEGMPAGLMSVVVQTQVHFTLLFAGLLTGDKLTLQQIIGILTAFVGLFTISLTIGSDIPVAAFMFTLGSAISWAFGNVLLKQLPKINMLHLVVWASLVPPIPALVISIVLDGPGALFDAISQASWLGLMSPLYLGLLASVFAYSIWGYLLQNNSTSNIAPFALLAPIISAMVSFVFGETFYPVQLAGMACMIVSVAIVVFQRKSVAAPLKAINKRRASAAVVDPSDIASYLRTIQEAGMRIVYVIDTYLHADHISAGHALAKAAGAEYVLHENASVTFQFLGVGNGDMLELGNVTSAYAWTHSPKRSPILLPGS